MPRYYGRAGSSRRTTWPEFFHIKSLMEKEEEDPLDRMKKIADLEGSLLGLTKARRELAGPSPGEKYTEEQRSKQVGSALEMFGTLYKTASPSSRRILGEQLTGLWGLMSESDKTKYKMLVNHTPINPRVQKAMWFEETNPRPKMPIVREGDGTWTNVPPRSEEYRRLWAEYDIASDEWNTLREMAVEGKSASEANWKTLPKQYQTDDPNVTMYRDPFDKRIKAFNWKVADQAEIATAIEKGWATQADMMTNGVIPLSAPREYVDSGRPVTVRQVREAVSGDVKLDYKAAGPLEERKQAPKALTDAVALIDSGIAPAKLEVKAPAVVGYYAQLSRIIKADGEERLALQLDLQRSIAAKYPSEERYLPFVPLDVDTGFWFWAQGMLDKVPLLTWAIPTPTVGGKGGNVLLVQADRLVQFSDKNGVERNFWWSDISKVPFDTNGVPITEMLGNIPGDAIIYSWEELERLRREGK